MTAAAAVVVAAGPAADPAVRLGLAGLLQRVRGRQDLGRVNRNSPASGQDIPGRSRGWQF